MTKYVYKYKYLGVIFTEHLDFNEHCNTMAEAGTRALGAVISKMKKIENMGYSTFTKCVESSFYPVLEYGAEIWGGIRESASDMVQLKVIKSFLGVHKFAPNISVLGDMGWCPARIRRCLCVLRYWNRLILLDEKRLTKKIFQTLKIIVPGVKGLKLYCLI